MQESEERDKKRKEEERFNRLSELLAQIKGNNKVILGKSALNLMAGTGEDQARADKGQDDNADRRTHPDGSDNDGNTLDEPEDDAHNGSESGQTLDQDTQERQDQVRREIEEEMARIFSSSAEEIQQRVWRRRASRVGPEVLPPDYFDQHPTRDLHQRRSSVAIVGVPEAALRMVIRSSAILGALLPSEVDELVGLVGMQRYLKVCVCVSAPARVRACVRVCVRVHVFVRSGLCLCDVVYVWVCLCLCLCLCVCLCVCVSVCIFVILFLILVLERARPCILRVCVYTSAYKIVCACMLFFSLHLCVLSVPVRRPKTANDSLA
jgi:hypothetical protein